MAARLNKQDTPSLRLREYRALEKVFGAEIEGTGFPYQSRARVYRELAEMDHIKETSVKTGPPGYQVTITGWILTERGRITYCEWAAKQAETDK